MIHKLALINAAVNMPVGFKPLSVQVQNEVPTLWYEFASEETEPVQFHQVLTGRSPPRGAEYLGTTLQYQGTFVAHWYMTRSDTP